MLALRHAQHPHAQPTAAGSVGGMIGSLVSQFARKVSMSAHACGSVERHPHEAVRPLTMQAQYEQQQPPHAATRPGLVAHSIGQQQQAQQQPQHG